jgi:SAM-dependent methyltransferase
MSMPEPTRNDADAMAARYARREVGDRYSLLRPEVWQSVHERHRVLIDLLNRHAPRPIGQLRVIEVGCGSGGNLLELARLGFDPGLLVGNELLPDRAAAARRSLPAASMLHEGDATTLQLEPASFDIVYQSTVFSSLLDDAFQRRLAESMWNWLRPGGAVLWYDFTYDNPRNPDVRGVPLDRIRALFPGGDFDVRRVTLAPPIARWVAPVHPALYTLINLVPLMRTHLLCWIRKP